MRWLMKMVISLNITVCSQCPEHHYNWMLASGYYKSSAILAECIPSPHYIRGLSVK
jgi:hypothetical protein